MIGFSQLGAESDWRSANTESMKSTFTADQGYKLLIEDGQQQQANQIMAIRKFIQQDVDYIVLAPVTETGWETVLEEARSANIPVIVIDHRIPKFRRTNQNMTIDLRPICNKGQRVKKGDILTDGYATENGELALGRNLLVAYIPWKGYNYEE